VADIFHEVEEELRKDKYNELLRKWGPLALAAALAVILGAAGWQFWGYWQTSQSHAMSDTYVAAVALVENEQLSEADLALQNISEEASNGYAGLALMQRGEMALQAGDNESAGYLFEQAAGEFETLAFSDLARVKAGMALFDILSINDLENRLSETMQPERPYRLLAMEVIAAKAFADGDMDRALLDYETIANDLDALGMPVSQRAQAAVELIGRIQQQEAPDETVTLDSLMPQLPDNSPVESEGFNLGAALDAAEAETLQGLDVDSPQTPDAAGLLENESAEDGQD
jgi:hypothetical protein